MSIVAPVLIWIFVVITGIGGHYNAPSTSMAPTINVGDHFYVSKISYLFSETKVPQRGEVIVFKNPKNSLVFTKRVIGLPDDTIEMIEGRLHINDKTVPRKHDNRLLFKGWSNQKIAVDQYTEYLPDSPAKHFIFEQSDDAALDYTERFEVPPGHIFVMGDHRDNSTDSRSKNGPGFVPVKNIIGDVKFIMFQSNVCDAEEGVYCPPKRFMKKL